MCRSYIISFNDLISFRLNARFCSFLAYGNLLMFYRRRNLKIFWLLGRDICRKKRQFFYMGFLVLKLYVFLFDALCSMFFSWAISYCQYIVFFYNCLEIAQPNRPIARHCTLFSIQWYEFCVCNTKICKICKPQSYIFRILQHFTTNRLQPFQ